MERLKNYIIAFLGGYTENDVDYLQKIRYDAGYKEGKEIASITTYTKGVNAGIQELARKLNTIAVHVYGKSKQEWIDAIYFEITKHI